MTVVQLPLLDVPRTPRQYHESITASVNAKGCMDVDTVKGCTEGMRSEPGGCYGECYAAKIATRYGIDFGTSVKRGFVDQWQHRDILVRQLLAHPATWYRIGTMGDPSHEWSHMLAVIRHLLHALAPAKINETVAAPDPQVLFTFEAEAIDDGPGSGAVPRLRR